MAPMGHSLAHSTCDVVCVVEEEFVVRENVLYVFSGFGGGKFGFLYGYDCWGVWEYVVSSCRHGIVVLSEAAFQVMMYVFWLVSVVGLGVGA